MLCWTKKELGTLKASYIRIEKVRELEEIACEVVFMGFSHTAKICIIVLSETANIRYLSHAEGWHSLNIVNMR